MTDWLVKTLIKRADEVGDCAVRRSYGMLSGCVGIVFNLLLTAGKCVAGVLTGSIAITADALNNLSDAGSSVVTLVGFRLAGKQADDDHPFGHGRIEYLSGLLVAMMIVLVGVELAKSSVGKILHPQAVVFSPLSIGILLCSMGVKLWMYFFNRSLSRRIHSAAMMATATDSISDVVTTAAVLLGTVAGHVFHLQIDGWVGAVVAVFIVRAGWGAAKDTLDPLLGQCPDPAFVTAIQDTVLAHPQISGIHDLVIHDYGPGRVMLSLHAEIPMDADLLEAHDIIDNIEKEIKVKYRAEAVLHMDPIATHDARTVALRKQVEALVREMDAGMSIHDFRITPGPRHTNLIFDVVAPYHVQLSDEAIRAAVEQRVAAMEGQFFAVVAIDRAYITMHS